MFLKVNQNGPRRYSKENEKKIHENAKYFIFMAEGQTNIKSEIFYHLFFTLIHVVNQSSIKVTKKVFFELEGKLHSISGRNSFPSINKETA